MFRVGGPAKREAQASKRTRSLAEEEPTGTSSMARDEHPVKQVGGDDGWEGAGLPGAVELGFAEVGS